MGNIYLPGDKSLPDADDIARDRLDDKKLERLRKSGRIEKVVRAPEIQPYRTWFDKLLDLFR